MFGGNNPWLQQLAQRWQQSRAQRGQRDQQDQRGQHGQQGQRGQQEGQWGQQGDGQRGQWGGQQHAAPGLGNPDSPWGGGPGQNIQPTGQSPGQNRFASPMLGAPAQDGGDQQQGPGGLQPGWMSRLGEAGRAPLQQGVQMPQGLVPPVQAPQPGVGIGLEPDQNEQQQFGQRRRF